jgi:hypothetical protein
MRSWKKRLRDGRLSAMEEEWLSAMEEEWLSVMWEEFCFSRL